MPNFEETYGQNHRRQQLLIGGLASLALLLSFAPRQERALFILPGLTAKAFSAATTPVDAAPITPEELYTLLTQPPRRAFLVRAPRPVGPAGVGPGFAPPIGNAAGPAAGLVPPAPAGLAGAPAIAGAGPAVGGNAPGFPFTPTNGGAPSTSPVAAVPAAAPGMPTAVPMTPVGLVAAVPEPAMWAMMIAGFMSVGAALRYRRGASVRSARP